jgi:TonB family protein
VNRFPKDVCFPSRIAATLTLVAASPLAAQTTLAGRVVDRSNHVPVAAVIVQLLAPADSVLQSSTTATDGTFALMAPRGATYRVRMIDRGTVHMSDSVTIAEGEFTAKEFPIDLSQRPFTEGEVDKPTVPAAGSPQPRYPAELQKKNVGGCALAEFVVDSAGQAEPATLRFVVSTRPEFAQAVMDALPKMRFVPAEHRGRKVRQFLSQPFGFSTDPYHEWECLPAEKKKR